MPFRAPPGIKLVRVNHKTGLPAGPGDKTAILEAFKPGQEPMGSTVEEPDRWAERARPVAQDDYGAPPPPMGGPGPRPRPGAGRRPRFDIGYRRPLLDPIFSRAWSGGGNAA